MKKKEFTISESGKLGGDKTNQKYGKAHYAKAGRKSWEVRIAKYGPGFMKRIRKKIPLDKQALV